jgi:hypothetical protein
MKVPVPGEEEAFIMRETNGPHTYPLVWDIDNPPEPGNSRERTQYDVNTATYKKFNAEASISLATPDLHGCSCLAIVSRKGVYFTHYWESIAYSPDDEDLKLEGLDQAGMFEKHVLSGLRDGIKGPKIIEQAPLRANAQALEDDHTYAFLIHPAPLSDNRNGYQVEAQKIRAAVEEYLPKIKSSGRFTLVPYTVEDDETIRDTTSAGRTLFQYDPKEADPQRRGYWTAKLKLWSETTVLHEDVWDYNRRG